MTELIAARGRARGMPAKHQRNSTLSCQLEDIPRHLGLWLSPVGSGCSLVGPMKRRMGRALGVGFGPESRCGLTLFSW